jgi:hypothetical protein
MEMTLSAVPDKVRRASQTISIFHLLVRFFTDRHMIQPRPMKCKLRLLQDSLGECSSLFAKIMQLTGRKPRDAEGHLVTLAEMNKLER